MITGIPPTIFEYFKLGHGNGEMATMDEEGRSGKLSDQSEVLLHCSVAI